MHRSHSAGRLSELVRRAPATGRGWVTFGCRRPTPACGRRNLAPLGFAAEAWYVGRTRDRLPFASNHTLSPRGRRALSVAVVAIAIALWGCSDKAFVVPPVIDRLGAKLPRSTDNFYFHESGGIPFSLCQYRFDFAPRDFSSFAAELPCPLGPAESGTSDLATVHTNDRPWYTPEMATRHRGCEGRVGSWDFSILVDVGLPDRSTAYIVLSD